MSDPLLGTFVTWALVFVGGFVGAVVGLIANWVIGRMGRTKLGIRPCVFVFVLLSPLVLWAFGFIALLVGFPIGYLTVMDGANRMRKGPGVRRNRWWRSRR